MTPKEGAVHVARICDADKSTLALAIGLPLLIAALQ